MLFIYTHVVYVVLVFFVTQWASFNMYVHKSNESKTMFDDLKITKPFNSLTFKLVIGCLYI